jgi:hypothetical protein
LYIYILENQGCLLSVNWMSYTEVLYSQYSTHIRTQM